MSLLLLFLFLFLFLPFSSPSSISTQFLFPNSSFTTLSFIDHSGTFLTSPSSTFILSFSPLPLRPSSFFLSLSHFPSNSLIWSANPSTPLPTSSSLTLSPSSLSLSFPNRSLAWSTPPLPSPIHSLQLLDSGNLLLLDSSNSSLWQSFDHPTDTLVTGQRLKLGLFLTSPLSNSDISYGSYRLEVTSSDVVLRWQGLQQQYWSLSTDAMSFKDYGGEVAYSEVNGTGFYLLDGRGRVVYRLVLRQAAGSGGLRVARMGYDGKLRIVDYDSGGVAEVLFVAPTDDCDLPFSCKSLGVCPSGSNGSTCSCPDSFGPAKDGGCSPVDGSVLVSSSSSSSSCGGDGASSSTEYLSLGSKVSYFANKFAIPIDGNDLSSCQNSCSMNCSCVGFFYRNSSMSCYLVENQLGSLMYTENNATAIGYIKTLKSSYPSSPSNTKGKSSTNIVAILLPLIATLLLLVILVFIGFQRWRKSRSKKRGGALVRMKSPIEEIKLGQPNSFEEDEFSDSEEISIPGLPTRFTCADLAIATKNFQTLIGFGGFGSVYKGKLPDKSLVAVKKITNIGIQGKKEFCTEIAVIGKIHHVNLVKLRGFCAQGSERMLVYEYMNRGSLEKPLFGQGPTLEWQERLEIAIGAARGLAYLHSGCDQKIIHCDIKPENILLGDHGQVKIADFGMAKLMSPEQSGLFTTMRGTRGYLAPEWLTNSAISDKTDVYSYGMVLLEIVRGRKNRCTCTDASSIDSMSSSGTTGEYFPMVAVERHVEGRWLELADPRMEGRVSEPEVIRAVKVALCCLHQEPWMRPSMASVVGMLEGSMAVSEPRVERLKFLRLYGRGSHMTASGVGNHTGTETSTASSSLLTFISSQDVSGPR